MATSQHDVANISTLQLVCSAMAEVDAETLEAFRSEARAWLETVAEPRRVDEFQWGQGSDSVAIFLNLTPEEEAELVHDAKAWHATKYDAGWGALTWPAEFGGRGLGPVYASAFASEEAKFRTPRITEVFGVTVGLIAPTIAAFGTDDQKAQFIRPLLRTDMLACQLFSEPGAGSDLASVGTKAVRDGDSWVLSGQKVWTSGAHVSDYGEAICRTDGSAAKHKGLTAFLVPLDADGVEIRPIRQITGGCAFNEVFLDEVRIPETLRLGGEGDGWTVALTTLANERGYSAGEGTGDSFHRVAALARQLGRSEDKVTRQALADLYARSKAIQFTGLRVRAGLRAGQTPGPEGSIGKLAWTQNMRRTTEVVSELLGPRLVADSGEWGTYAWAEFVLGAPGYRIAGGSDEIQRNIIGERVLGLPREPRPPVQPTATPNE
jgi:acyl-CoA dehydrogenase